MNFKSAAASLLVAGAVVSGCGGDDEKATAGKPDSAQATQADASAKASARLAVSELEACYVDTQDYSGCKLTEAGAELTDSSAAGYAVTATSTSGNSFVVRKDDAGALSRTCTTKGDGGCPAGGTW